MSQLNQQIIDLHNVITELRALGCWHTVQWLEVILKDLLKAQNG